VPGGSRSERSIEGFESLTVVTDKEDFVQCLRSGREPGAGCVRNHRRRLGLRIAEDTRRDRRHGNSAGPVLGRRIQRRGYRLNEQSLVVLSLAIAGTDDMDDQARSQLSPCGYGGTTRFDGSMLDHPGIGLRLQARTGRPGYRRGHSTSVLQVFVGRVYDGIDIESGDITLYRSDCTHYRKLRYDHAGITCQ